MDTLDHLEHIRALDLDGKYQEMADYLLTLDVATLERLQREAAKNNEIKTLSIVNRAHLLVSITSPNPARSWFQ